jgi:SpoVK/Ycf46/Vps4 family AAA+-type ATPase
VRKLNGAELLSPYVGETEQRIRSFVREVRASDACSVVFIDEVDSIARSRGAAGNVHSDRFLSSWLAELEGFDGRAPCIVIAATNRLDMIDAAFRSRFSDEIEMPRPRMEAARAIFARHLAPELPYDTEGSTGALSARQRMIDAAVARLYLPNAPGALLATLRLRDGKTRAVFARDLISGRLIEQISVDARRRAFQRQVEGGAPGLRIDDIDAAVDAARERLRATLTPANAHAHLGDLPHDLGVAAVEPAPRVRGGVTFIHEAAR